MLWYIGEDLLWQACKLQPSSLKQRVLSLSLYGVSSVCPCRLEHIDALYAGTARLQIRRTHPGPLGPKASRQPK